MKKMYFIIVLSVLCCHSYSQQLRQVGFTESFDLAWFTIITNQNILIRISGDGNIIEAGTEEQALYNRNYFSPNLRPYQGNMGYYDDRSDSAFTGKIKNIGVCFFTYYSSKDYPEKAGKIKSAGSLFFDYYRSYEDVSIAGRIKNMGSNAIAYFTSLDDAVLKGKLKMVGTTPITYYSSYDNVLFKGKLKSIGSYHCEWTTVYSGGQSIVTLKSGYQRQLINGVTYVIR
ncbi:MAG TPA: hypothetical protein VFW07_09245 [Parafilimonas sp.]|nr:hypothetical protein [Parafilimonas sp.]